MTDDLLAALRRRYAIGDPQRQAERVAHQMGSDPALRQQVCALASSGHAPAVQSLDLVFDTMPDAVWPVMLGLAAGDQLSDWRIRRIVLKRVGAARERPDSLAVLNDLAGRSRLSEVREAARHLLGIPRSIADLIACLDRNADGHALEGAVQELASHPNAALAPAIPVLIALTGTATYEVLILASRLLARSGATTPPPALLAKAAAERQHEAYDHPPALFSWLSAESGDSAVETERLFRANAIANAITAAVTAGLSWWPAGCPAELHPQGWAYLLRATWTRLGQDGLHAAFVTALVVIGSAQVRGPEHELLFLLAWYALADDGDPALAQVLVETIQTHHSLWTLRELDMIRILREKRKRL